MSATGFQRRRRELAQKQAEQEQSEVVTGGEDDVPPVDPDKLEDPGNEEQAPKPEGDGSGTETPPVDPNVSTEQAPTEQSPVTEQPAGLAALSKRDLLEYIWKRKLFDKAYKDMEPAAIIPLFLKAVQAKLVTAKLKTDIEVAAMTEAELLEAVELLK
jgi:hypothetical protein